MIRSLRQRRPSLYLVSHQQEIRRQLRIRSLHTLVRLTLFVFLGLCVIALFTSPRFTIQQIRVRGARRADEALIRKAASHLQGHNVLRASTVLLAQRVKEIPQVREVSVVRWPVWPFARKTSLTVQIGERRPVFALRTGDEYLLVDASGKVFHHEPVISQLPVAWVEGVVANVGGDIPRDSLDAVLTILRETKAAGISRVTAIMLDRDGFASLRLAEGTLVRLGDEEWARKIRWLPRALLMVSDKGTPVQYIDITSREAPTWKAIPRKGI